MQGPEGVALRDDVAEAVACGDWSAVVRLLRGAELERALLPQELEQLAQAAYASGDLEGAVTAWEQLHTDRVEEGDHLGAASAAATIAMHLMMDTGLMAPVRGWSSRAERLLEGRGETPVHAQVAMVRTYERIMCGDLERAGEWARRAVTVGTRQHAPAAAAVGRVALARLAILDGRIDEGLALLDDAAVATVSGELDPVAVGVVYCELICAMQGLAQYDRAEEWTDAMERWRHGQAVGGFNGRCRVHRAEILRLRGSCEEAEEEALHACDELRPWMRREFGWPLTELGTIRLRRGDLAGAEEAFLAAHASGWEPQPGWALLRLAQGEARDAATMIEEALERPMRVPSKERPPQGGLRRAPLLEARVEIALAVGDFVSARSAAEELTEVAELFRSRALAAAAALARGRVALAEDDVPAAISECGEAVGAWSEVGAPYEAAVARLVLAQAHRVAGSDDAALIELATARAGLERTGARLRAEEAAAAEASIPGARPSQAGSSRVGARDRVGVGPSVFRLEGDTRRIEFDGEVLLLRDLKGMRYLARLLAEPGREFHVLDLVSVEAGSVAVSGSREAGELSTGREGDAGPMLDERAREAYRRRLREIEDDIDEATRLGDSERASLAAADRDYLVRELASAFGLGGRARRIGDTSERARASVTRALRYAQRRIADHHRDLGRHLERTVRTGTYCSYVPDPRVPGSWAT